MVERLDTPRFWVPGWRQVIVFAGLSLSGLLAWGMGAGVLGDAPLLAVLF